MDNDSASRKLDLASCRRSFRAWHAILLATFAVGAFSIFFRLGDAKSLGSHEGYAIVPAREMLLTGDYVVPRFGGMPRLQKPPLIYWSILAAANVTGTLDITTARLPAAIAGLLLGGLICAWGYRWYGRAGAIGALAAQLTSVYVLVFARKAEADLILVFLIAIRARDARRLSGRGVEAADVRPLDRHLGVCRRDVARQVSLRAGDDLRSGDLLALSSNAAGDCCWASSIQSECCCSLRRRESGQR